MLNELRKNNEIIDIFCSLAEIPSPSLKEDKVILWIKNFCNKNSIPFSQDSYGNVYIYIEATDVSKKPIMLSSHMDVVGDDSEIILSLDGNFIKANDRTLGADDKVGVTCALNLAKYITQNDIKHGGLEIIFTKDEETNMSGIAHIDFSKIKSEYVLVCDADKLGQVQISGASYTSAYIFIHSLKGGHSGIDIADTDRLNAAKLMAELIAKFPQGVFFQDKTGVITSCNIGAIVAGGVQNIIKSFVNDKYISNDYITDIVNKSSTNIINTLAGASYSIRSASVEREEALKKQMTEIVDEFNKKYRLLAEATIKFTEKLPPFEKADDDLIANLHTKVSKKLGLQNEISSFHAGAETHIYANNVNSNGKKFKPVLLGLADIYNMHSANEKVDYKTLLNGYEIIKSLFLEYNI